MSFFGLVEGQGGFSSADFISSRGILKSLCVIIWFHLWYGLGYHDEKCPLCVFCSALVSASFGSCVSKQGKMLVCFFWFFRLIHRDEGLVNLVTLLCQSIVTKVFCSSFHPDAENCHCLSVVKVFHLLGLILYRSVSHLDVLLAMGLSLTSVFTTKVACHTPDGWKMGRDEAVPRPSA